MKRLLCIVNNMNTGGAETFLMKLYRSIDRTQYQFDFCVTEPGEGFYYEEIRRLGGRIHKIEGKSKHPIRSMVMLWKLVREERYESVIRMGWYAFTALDLLVAKLAGAKRVALRSATGTMSGSWKKRLFLHWIPLPIARLVPNVKIAPSDLAAQFMFGKRAYETGKVLLLNNGVDTSQFVFDEQVRRQLREKLGLDDGFVVGHVGRLSSQKNHKFLFQIFHKIKAERPDAMLCLVGGGELEHSLRQQVRQLGLEESVRFLGIRSDVPRLLMAFDVMVFPSFFEGMPNTVIEAQATGLHCVIADTITKGAAVTDRVEYLSLEDSADTWAQQALQYAKPYERPDMKPAFVEKGYDISAVAEQFCRVMFEA